MASRACSDIQECIDVVSKVTGQTYTYGREIQNRKIGFTSNFEITQENADLVITNALLLNDLTRIPTGGANSYYIVESKTALQAPISIRAI